MATAHPRIALRPMLPADVPVLIAIFRASIEELTEDDYSPAQQEAWASGADDEEAFAERLTTQLTLIGTVEGSPAGFVSLQGNRVIDLLYVHPAAARQGIAAMLVDAVEKLAAARGATDLHVDASDTAREFFAKRGFVAMQRNTVSIGNEWLGNTTMKKTLAPKPAQA